MKNLIRSKEEQIRKQEAEIDMKSRYSYSYFHSHCSTVFINYICFVSYMFVFT